MYFGNNGLPKTWLDQWLKSPVSEYPSKSNMVNAHKHCSHLKGSPFTILIDHWEVKRPTKRLCYLYAKSQICFLTHCVPMPSILFLIETTQRNEFRWNYLEK